MRARHTGPLGARFRGILGYVTASDLIDYAQFEAITFDGYGTLIDWEAGLTNAFRAVLEAHGRSVAAAVEADSVAGGPIALRADDLLARYARYEAAAEAGPFLRYRRILATGLLGVAGELGFEPTAAEVDRFSGSVADWPAFADSAAALSRLKTRFRLGVLTNCDDDLFAASNVRLGVEFDWVVTAQQVGSYKPAEANFLALFDRVDVPRERILHVAQSLYHDHVTARRLGLSTVWIDRRHDRPGAGATPPVEGARPNATYPDMASFAAAAVSQHHE